MRGAGARGEAHSAACEHIVAARLAYQACQSARRVMPSCGCFAYKYAASSVQCSVRVWRPIPHTPLPRTGVRERRSDELPRARRNLLRGGLPQAPVAGLTAARNPSVQRRSNYKEVQRECGPAYSFGAGCELSRASPLIGAPTAWPAAGATTSRAMEAADALPCAICKTLGYCWALPLHRQWGALGRGQLSTAQGFFFVDGP